MSTATYTTYRTSWRRTGALAAVALTAMVALGAASRLEVTGQQLRFQDGQARIATSGLSGDEVGFGVTEMLQRGADGQDTTAPVLRASGARTRINGFCLSQEQELPVIGTVTLTATAGDGDPETYEIAARSVLLDIINLRADDRGINLDGVVQIGVASSDITTVEGLDNPLAAPTADGGVGWFGIDAGRGEIFDVHGRLHNAVLGEGSLPNLEIKVARGKGPHCDQLPLPN